LTAGCPGAAKRLGKRPLSSLAFLRSHPRALEKRPGCRSAAHIRNAHAHAGMSRVNVGGRDSRAPPPALLWFGEIVSERCRSSTPTTSSARPAPCARG
jgi:hypothetical protein